MPITPREALKLSIDDITALAKLDDYIIGELITYYRGYDMNIKIDRNTPRHILEGLVLNYVKAGWESVELVYNTSTSGEEFAYLTFHSTLFTL